MFPPSGVRESLQTLSSSFHRLTTLLGYKPAAHLPRWQEFNWVACSAKECYCSSMNSTRCTRQVGPRFDQVEILHALNGQPKAFLQRSVFWMHAPTGMLWDAHAVGRSSFNCCFRMWRFPVVSRPAGYIVRSANVVRTQPRVECKMKQGRQALDNPSRFI